MNKTKKNRKNNKTFRKFKKGGMEKDDDGHYYPSYIKENKEKMDQRKDLLTRSERKRMSKSQRKKNKKDITDLTRLLRELDINPSPKRSFNDTRGNYTHYHTRKSPKKTLKGGFNPKEWFEDVLFNRPFVIDETTNFHASYGFLNFNQKQAVDKYLKDMDSEEHDKLMEKLNKKIEENDEEIKRMRELFYRYSPPRNNK